VGGARGARGRCGDFFFFLAAVWALGGLCERSASFAWLFCSKNGCGAGVNVWTVRYATVMAMWASSHSERRASGRCRRESRPETGRVAAVSGSAMMGIMRCPIPIVLGAAWRRCFGYQPRAQVSMTNILPAAAGACSRRMRVSSAAGGLAVSGCSERSAREHVARPRDVAARLPWPASVVPDAVGIRRHTCIRKRR